jgi:hypothetical protein
VVQMVNEVSLAEIHRDPTWKSKWKLEFC